MLSLKLHLLFLVQNGQFQRKEEESAKSESVAQIHKVAAKEVRRSSSSSDLHLSASNSNIQCSLPPVMFSILHIAPNLAFNLRDLLKLIEQILWDIFNLHQFIQIELTFFFA